MGIKYRALDTQGKQQAVGAAREMAGILNDHFLVVQTRAPEWAVQDFKKGNPVKSPHFEQIVEGVLAYPEEKMANSDLSADSLSL